MGSSDCLWEQHFTVCRPERSLTVQLATPKAGFYSPVVPFSSLECSFRFLVVGLGSPP